jgi:uncharacterized protein YceK
MIRSCFLAIAVCSIVSGCANPLNRATSDRYTRMCSEALQNHLLDVAENACYRALVNVDMGNLGPELKSQRLLNLALIKRALKKFDEAEVLLQESLRIEETLTGPSSEKVGRRLAELAAVKYQKAQYIEGFPLLERLEPIASHYSGPDRFFVSALFHCYAIQAEQNGQAALATRFRTVSSGLQAIKSDFKCG